MIPDIENEKVPYQPVSDSNRFRLTAPAKLFECIKAHFPEASEVELVQTSNDLYNRHSVAVAYQSVERMYKSQTADLKALRSAEKKLRDAERAIRDIGVWGGEALVETAHQLTNPDGDLFAVLRPSGLQARDLVATKLGDIRQSIHGALELGTKSVDQQWSNQAKKGTPKKTVAEVTSLKLYDTFLQLSGETPAVENDRQTDEKGGPFLEFVKDTFSVLEVNASPENMARQACREKKRKNK